jgi:hypothetical protein
MPIHAPLQHLSTWPQAAHMLEQVAAVAIRSRLRRCDGVDFNVACTLPDLLSGQVGIHASMGCDWHGKSHDRCGPLARGLRLP